tara:strand:- start:264 stop:1031 length:768 start_codon:yes stop_codon:yes gene_type:complete
MSLNNLESATYTTANSGNLGSTRAPLTRETVSEKSTFSDVVKKPTEEVTKLLSAYMKDMGQQTAISALASGGQGGGGGQATNAADSLINLMMLHAKTEEQDQNAAMADSLKQITDMLGLLVSKNLEGSDVIKEQSHVVLTNKHKVHRFMLPESHNPFAKSALRVLDSTGKLVQERPLTETELTEGRIAFDGVMNDKERLAPGLYDLKLISFDREGQKQEQPLRVVEAYKAKPVTYEKIPKTVHEEILPIDILKNF